MKDPSLPSESEITLPKTLATRGWMFVKMTHGSERVKVSPVSLVEFAIRLALFYGDTHTDIHTNTLTHT